MTSVGPFSLNVALAGAALLLAWLVTRRLAKGLDTPQGKNPPALLLDSALVGLLAARLGYIAQWWEEYRAAPMAMLAIGDGGLALWTGLPIAATFLFWRTQQGRQSWRKPMIAGALAGILAWGFVTQLFNALLHSAPPLPDIALHTPDGESVPLHTFQGKPVVVNLWATWCPPCRREMPVFVHAQQAYPDAHIVLANQGDERDLVTDYLSRYNLNLQHVLLDSGSQMMQATGARVLPTTLFYDAQGQLVDTHVGELTRASLADRLHRRFNLTAQ